MAVYMNFQIDLSETYEGNAGFSEEVNQ